ncbi:GTPase-activating BEM3-like protein [Cladobotryum mycophilum]|uniref:GTPase-activating BEM3-like protein n=1 Tax=Cladobotryum mycophilum TaxID=491253 RepID=A0ABR0SGW2_9HYPO
MTEASHQSGHTKSQSGPTGRTKVYRGLVTEEYPDLLLPPNALPSIDVKVASSRMKPSRASLMALTQLEEDPVFTLAVISRVDNGELWRVEKDSASLAKLDQRLKLCPTFTARTPDRSLFSGHAPAKLDARRLALDQYMDELLNTPLDTTTAVELCRYLSTNTLPPNADEIGPAGRPNAESVPQKPDSRPTKTGYLTKKGKNFGGWKARFFVLDGSLLKYYEAPGGAHLGTIKLQHAQIGKQSQGNEGQSSTHPANDEDIANQYRHAFLILEPKKKDSSNHVKHVLCAESDVERDMWVETLLQWIDHRDSNEEPTSAKLNPHDRPVHGQNALSGGKPKKVVQVKTHHSSGSDTLIGVRYDSTHAGETPQGAPGNRPRTAGGLDQHPTGADLQQKIISGPKDGQIISDSAAWGNRVVPTPTHPTHPTNDEKKQRKRSFFGFGAKARSSSDGQESMFGGSENGVSPTPPQNAFQGPVRQVFGAPLAEAVRYNAPLDVSVPLPSVVYRCIQYLESQNAIFEEGIFRLSGSNVVIKQLRERFNTEGDVNIVTDEQYYDIHAVASLLKLYLRELPTSILTRDLHLEFLSTMEMPDRDEKLAALKELVLRLPQANATLLKYLIAFLIRIINNADVNKMTVRNVGIVFSPTLHIPASVFAIFLQNYEPIFGIDPEEYELPSPVSDADGNPGRPESTPRFEMAGRPSTSSGSASPQRQGWIESVRDQSRSTPTPPLLMNLNAARGSPTPSGTSRQSYETSYLLQSPRPGAISQATSEATTADHESVNHQTQHQASPAFDLPSQPLEEEQSANGPTYDQHGMKHISNSQQQQQQQVAKSRLREETHF